MQDKGRGKAASVSTKTNRIIGLVTAKVDVFFTLLVADLPHDRHFTRSWALFHKTGCIRLHAQARQQHHTWETQRQHGYTHWVGRRPRGPQRAGGVRHGTLLDGKAGVIVCTRPQVCVCVCVCLRYYDEYDTGRRRSTTVYSFGAAAAGTKIKQKVCNTYCDKHVLYRTVRCYTHRSEPPPHLLRK